MEWGKEGRRENDVVKQFEIFILLEKVDASISSSHSFCMSVSLIDWFLTFHINVRMQSFYSRRQQLRQLRSRPPPGTEFASFEHILKNQVNLDCRKFVHSIARLSYGVPVFAQTCLIPSLKPLCSAASVTPKSAVKSATATTRSESRNIILIVVVVVVWYFFLLASCSFSFSQSIVCWLEVDITVSLSQSDSTNMAKNRVYRFEKTSTYRHFLYTQTSA